MTTPSYPAETHTKYLWNTSQTHWITGYLLHHLNSRGYAGRSSLMNPEYGIWTQLWYQQGLKKSQDIPATRGISNTYDK